MAQSNLENENWTTVIKPRNKLFEVNLKEIWDYRDLLTLFVKRTITVQYKQTILGPLWWIIQPTFTVIMYMVVFGVIPVFTNTVKINGEVMYSNTTPFVKGKNLKYYIEKAGGFSEKAKKNKAYVVYMNGSVSKAKKRSSKLVQPGCEIIVPARQQRDGLKTTEILSLGSTSASLATVVLALMNLLK